MPTQPRTRKAAPASKAAAPKPAARRRAAPAQSPLSIDLALQGGGSHGAFTWGVLDRLLEEDGLRIEGISGTSAGAMNAAVLVDGYERGGAEGARQALATFWRAVSDAARFSPLQRGPLDVLLGRWSLEGSPAFLAMDLMSRVLSPYDLNPFGINPLHDILERSIDFDALSKSKIKLFITATNVRTGRGRVFRNAELTPDVLLASACLPNMFQAVQVDGEYYWDGGYSGNPALAPLVELCSTRDILLVQINPRESSNIPDTASDIADRLNEVTFNASLLGELRAIDFVRRLLAEGKLDPQRYKNVLLHRIDGGAALSTLGAASKTRADLAFVLKLFELGRAQGQLWAQTHFADVGVRQTLQILDHC